MKKLLAMLLAMLMVLSLAACGGNSGNNESPNPDTNNSQQPEGPAYTEATISVTISNGETESAGVLAKYFFDYVTEKTGGAVKFDVYYGGTLCAPNEILDFVGGGSVDMTMSGTAQFAAELPLVNFPSYVYGTQEEALKYAQYIAFENETTSAAIAAELAEYNLVTVGVNAGGGNAYFFKNEYASLGEATAAGLLLGCGANLACYEALGFNTTNTMPWDCYDQLSRGVIDCTQMAIGPATSMNWNEVAPYMLVNGQYAFGNWWLINQDVWNSLNADTQAVFYEAALAAQAFSVEQYKSELTDAEAAFTAVHVMSAEDQAAEEAIFFQQSFADCRAAAAAAGKTDAMEAILAATNEFLGLNIQ